MTITTPAEFRTIGINDGRMIATEKEAEISMMFDPPNGPEHTAYLEGVIVGLRAQLIGLEPDEEGLKLSVTREVEPKEITYMVFGTGALTYPWWGGVQWISVQDGDDFPVEDTQELEIAEPTDVIELRYDRAEDDEGTFKGKARLTFQQIIDAAAKAIRSGHIYEKDAIQEDLGLLDSEQADVVLQIAVFGEIVYG